MTMNENRRRGASFLYYLTDMISPSFIDTALLRATSAECTIRSVYEMALWIVESPFSVAVYHETACLFYDEYRYYSVEVLRRTRCVEPQETSWERILLYRYTSSTTVRVRTCIDYSRATRTL